MPEQTIMKFHPVRSTFLKNYIIGILLIAASILIFFDLIPMAAVPQGSKIYVLAPFLIGVAVMALAEYSRSTDTYIITSNRFIERVGTFATRELFVEWGKVAQHVKHQSFIDRMFDQGRLEIKTMGGAGAAEIYTKKIPHIKKVEQLIIDLTSGKAPEPAKPMPPAPPPAAPR